ncbi:hypothetical protein Tsubulata_009760 [Turnera subulata]|uniref:Glutaredoxin domain-containing protein n=1 Tax=Turnera subulata TaxID=218843 RepID=A0A9Q0F5A3_9ROSI|nr:hypothetical protein Tsubulata_009760 [Turnera subulata]
MGCASSKQKRCKNCQAPYSPVPRSYSMHVVHPPQKKGDTCHLVALQSTTLGSLALDPSIQNHHQKNGAIDVATKRDADQKKHTIVDVKENGVVNHHHVQKKSTIGGGDGKENGVVNHHIEKSTIGVGDGKANGVVNHHKEEEPKKKEDEFTMGLIEAKTWSNMIQEKIPKVVPKTPIMTPPGEPETINTWELMAGLEDTSPIHVSGHRFRSFSFDVSRDSAPVIDSPKLISQQTLSPIVDKPIWEQLTDDDAKCPEFDPEVISSFRKSLQELSPTHPFYIKPTTDGEKQNPSSDLPLDVVFDAKKANGVAGRDYKCSRGRDKVVVYFTSLRGVRKTYEDCCHVRVILKGLGVRVDERDVSMHSGFKEELKELMGEGYRGGGLPKVFVGKKYIGGAEEIKRMHEDGQLEKAIEGCEMVDDGGGAGGGGACEACGDIRFVPCETCSGSCKVYYEGDEEEQVELGGSEEGGGEYGFQRCPDCNENGLIRCPICCD